jgi:hypothetical protein
MYIRVSAAAWLLGSRLQISLISPDSWCVVYVAASTTSRSLVKRSPAGCLCLIACDLETWIRRWRRPDFCCWRYRKNIRFYSNPMLLCGPGRGVGIATGYGLDGPGSNPGGPRFSAPLQTSPGAHPASCTMGTGSFPGVKSGRGVTLTPHPLLVLWLWKGRAIPLLSLRAVQPVQSHSACARVHFTFLPMLLYI